MWCSVSVHAVHHHHHSHFSTHTHTQTEFRQSEISNMLPVHGGSKNNGVSGIPVVNKYVLLSLLWVAGSIALMIFGYWHCQSSSFSYVLDCDERMCTYSTTGSKVIEPIVFLRSDMISSQMVKIRKGELLSPDDKSRGRLGYTLELEFKMATGSW